jgi:hypothetical protein
MYKETTRDTDGRAEAVADAHSVQQSGIELSYEVYEIAALVTDFIKKMDSGYIGHITEEKNL